MGGENDVRESAALRAKWDRRYRDAQGLPPPAAVLEENRHLLPARGRALDLACGLGANALMLAARGLDVVAWDLSRVAIERLRRESSSRGLDLQARVRDVCRLPPAPESFDLIVVSYFLDRGLVPKIDAALRPGGLLFYQTFVRDGGSGSGPSNPVFRLGINELLRLFPSLLVRFYREQEALGNPNQEGANLAQLVAQKPRRIRVQVPMD